jgi:hypothetical protein
LTKLSRLATSQPERHKLLLTGPTTGIERLLVEDTLSSLVLHTKGAPAQIEGTRSEMFKCSEAKRCLG